MIILKNMTYYLKVVYIIILRTIAAKNIGIFSKRLAYCLINRIKQLLIVEFLKYIKATLLILAF